MNLEITKEELENQLGYKLNDFSIKPLYENEQCVGLSIEVSPVQKIKQIFIPLTISKEDLENLIHKTLNFTDYTGLHAILCDLDILGLSAEENEIKQYYDKLPDDLKVNILLYGLSNAITSGDVYLWFKNNL